MPLTPVSAEYSVDFFKGFDLVLNALDNLGLRCRARSIPLLIAAAAARNHVNRMCLAADIPLIESGTAGYLGQARAVRGGVVVSRAGGADCEGPD